jgi:hypothetical protein
MLTSRPTHGGGAPFGIDLDAGIAKITVRRPAATAPTTPADEADQQVESAEAPSDADEPTKP